MQPRAFLITNGGAHPPDKIAEAATMLVMDMVQIEPTAPAGATIQKAEFELSVLKILNSAAIAAQQFERTGLHADGDKRLAGDLDVGQFVDPAVKSIVEAAKAAPLFADHFAKPEVQDILRHSIGGVLATSMHEERSWHVDGKHLSKRTGQHEPRRGFDPNSKQRKDWLARHKPDETPAA